MTVAELIELLKGMAQDAMVVYKTIGHSSDVFHLEPVELCLLDENSNQVELI